MASGSEASCISDPNFAVICAFLERFAKSCGISYPTFVDLQEMLENVEQVPQELIDLHIKLLRKARRTVFIEKWEKALIKFCHTYSSQDGWEIEQFGYKKSRLEVKLRVLKMLLEGQFDLNNKFKASINTLESDELRSKPLGKDKLGRVYWLQSDPTSNIRVYREDLDEESWTLVAKDRPSMVDLLQELSGEEFPLDLNLLNEDSTSLDVDKPVRDTGQPNGGTNDEESSIIQSGKGEKDPLETVVNGSNPATESERNLHESKDLNEVGASGVNGVENANYDNAETNKKIKLDENVKELREELIKDEVIVGDAIEEPVMYVVGEGSGEDCNTGNPDKDEKPQEECEGTVETGQVEVEDSAQNSSETDFPPSQNAEKLKPAPKLWSIDTICGVSNSSEINESDRQEVTDVKVKHKNFSSFSIDSVLEKKDLSSPVCEGSFSKVTLSNPGDSYNEKLKVSETESSLGQSNSVLTKVMNSDIEVNLVHEDSDPSSEVNSKTENVLCEVEKSDSNSNEKEPLYSKIVPEESEKNSANLSDTVIAEKIENKNLVNEVKEISVNEGKQLMVEMNEPDVKSLSAGGKDEIKEVSEVEIIDLKPPEEMLDETKEVFSVEDAQIQNFTEKTPLMSKITEKNEDSKADKPEEMEEKESLDVENVLKNKSDEFKPEDAELPKSSLKTDAEKKMNEDRNAKETDKLLVDSPDSELKACEKDEGKRETEQDAKVEEVSNDSETAELKFPDLREIRGSVSVSKNDTVDEAKNICEGIENAPNVSKEKKVMIDQMEEKVDKECKKEGSGFISKTGGETSALEVADEKGEVEKTQELVVNAMEVKTEQKGAKDGDSVDTEKEDLTEYQGSVMKEKKEVIETTSKNVSSEHQIEERVQTVEVSDNEKEKGADESGEKNEKETNAVVQGNKSVKKKKKEILPQRVLSRNRRTVEGPNAATEEVEKPKGKGRKREKLKGNETQEAIVGPEKAEEINEIAIEEKKEEEVKEENPKHSEIQEGSESGAKEKIGEEEAGGDEQEIAKTKPRRGRRLSRKRRRWWKRNISKENPIEGEDKDNLRLKENEEKEEGKVKKKGRPKKEDAASQSGNRQIQCREIKLLGITEAETELPSIRQSRRIAQIKMKEEAERRRIEALQLESFKEKKNKKSKTRKKKSKQNPDSDSYDEKNDNEEGDSDEEKGGKKDKSRKRWKKKDKLKFDELNPWLSSSGSSTADEEEEEIEEEPHEDEELVFKSDHEFSPESDVEDPDYKPIKRARTAKVEESKDEAGKYDDTACEKCGNNDHPEWILLCDKCDKGWHASCVRPALMVIPEGDWFCPPCEHLALITKLQESLTHYDRCQKQRENEELRRKRLAFVGISLDNVLPPAKNKSAKHENGETNRVGDEDLSSSESDSSSESESSGSGTSSEDSSEPVYQLRERRSNVTSYRYNEYDELIKSALQEEIEAVKGAGNSGRGKDISNIVNAERQGKEKEEEVPQEDAGKVLEATKREETGDEEGEVERSREKRKKRDEDYEMDTEGDEEEDEDENIVDEIPPVVPKSSNKKKSKSVKITSLDFTSEEEDHNSDSDFKGTSSEEESDYSLPSESESSDDIGRKRKGDGPLRRSTRARVSRYDRDFINDESEEDEPRRKKTRRSWESSESSESDRSWGRRKRKGNKSTGSKPRGSSKSKKKKKQKKRSFDSDEDVESPKRGRNRKIKFGGLESLEEEKVLTRRTRGKKINYQEMNGSESDDEGRTHKSRPARIIESDDDFVAENEKDDMQEGESEEMESGVDEEEENGRKEKSSEDRKKFIEKMKKKKWVIPDPDDFSENDLMEDKQLDEFTEELEDLDEEEEEILGKILESGDVPIQELRAAVKRVKEKKLKEGEMRDHQMGNKEPMEVMAKTLPPIPAHMEHPGGGKFPKIGKMKITPSRAELATQLGESPHHCSVPRLGAPVNFLPNSGRVPPTEKSVEARDPTQLKNKEIEAGNFGSSFLLRTLQSEAKVGSVSDANIPPNHSAKDELPVIGQGPFVSYPVESVPVGPLNMMAMMNSMPQTGTGGNPGMMPMSVSNGRPMPQFGAFQGIIPPPSGLPPYPAAIPTTVTGISNLDPQSRKKPGPKVATKVKRKIDDMSPQIDESSESGDLCLPLQQGDEFVSMKGLQDSPPKKKGRGRGKKQLLAEAQAQAQAQGKTDLNVSTVQAPTQFPPQGLPSEGGSVITRMLNTPQTFAGTESNQFPPGPRNPPPFRPPLSPHFPNPPRSPAPLRLRVPVPGGTIFHTSHPLDPSPSGGGAITIPCTSGNLTKSAPPSPPFNRTPGGPIISRFPADPTVRHLFPSTNSPPRPEFSSFPNYYGNFHPTTTSLPGSEDPPFQNPPPFPEQFGEGQVPAGSSKPFEDETGGEFGGLASYFASQREDDLDT